MKKVCENWANHLPVSSQAALFEEFKTRATAVAAEVITVKSGSEAVEAVKKLAAAVGAKKIVAVN